MNNKQTIEYRKKIVDQYKVSNGCEECGYNNHPASLCFDHLPQYEKNDVCKSGSKAGGMYMLYSKKFSVQELINEIAKCRIVCHNCHMANTHKISFIKYDKKMSIEELQQSLNAEH